jgi:hypothetical protein
MRLVIPYFIFVHVSLLIPGYVLARNLKILKNHPCIELPFGYMLSIVLMGLLATAHYALNVPAHATQGLFWLLFFSTLSIFIYQRLYKQIVTHWIPLLALLAISLFSLAFVSLTFSSSYKYIPDPEQRSDRNYNVLSVKVLNLAATSANDNYIPYRQAQFFVNNSDPAKDSFINEWGVGFFQRTPLMGAVVAQYFNSFSDRPPIGYTWSSDSQDRDNTYVKFQIIAQILNSVFILPAFYLLIYFFKRKAAIMAILFIIPSQFFLYNSIFSWPKSLVAFFILLSWLLLTKKGKGYVLLAGVTSGFAYLTHDLAVLYIGASCIFLLSQKRFKDTFIFGAAATIFAIPWIVISSVVYSKPSSFLYYPVSTSGIPQIENRSQIIQTFQRTPLIRLLKIRLESLYYLLSPYQLIYSEGGQTIERRVWALGLYSILGSVGVGLIIPMVFGVVKRIKDIRLWILILVPVILSVVMIGWPKGLGSMHFAQVSVIMLTGLAAWWLGRCRSPMWALAAYSASTLQTLFFISYSYNFKVLGMVRNFEDGVQLGVLVGILVACGVALYLVTRQKPYDEPVKA